jgi:hypothetical protein
MRDLELVNTEIDGVEAIDAGFIAIGREPHAGLEARQRDMGSSDDRAGGIEDCAGYGSAAGLRVQGARQSESGGQPYQFCIVHLRSSYFCFFQALSQKMWPHIECVLGPALRHFRQAGIIYCFSNVRRRSKRRPSARSIRVNQHSGQIVT